LIFPTLVKGGFIYAGRYGTGVVLARNEATGQWSTPAFARVSGGSFGLQLGVNWSELILIGKPDYDLHNFEGGTTVSGSASASFGPWGVHSEIGTGWQLNSAMNWHSKNVGLFAAIATDGTFFSYDEEANKTYYGEDANPRSILFSNAFKPTATGQMLIDSLTEYEQRVVLGPIVSTPQPYAKPQKQASYYQSPDATQNYYAKDALDTREAALSVREKALAAREQSLINMFDKPYPPPATTYRGSRQYDKEEYIK